MDSYLDSLPSPSFDDIIKISVSCISNEINRLDDLVAIYGNSELCVVNFIRN